MQKTGRQNKPYEAATPDDVSYEPQANLDPQSMATDERKIRTETHRHNGMDAPKIDIRDLAGYIETISSPPASTDIPNDFFGQFKVYANAGTRRLYVYVRDSPGAGGWHFTTL